MTIYTKRLSGLFRPIWCGILLYGASLFAGLRPAYADEKDDFFDRIKVAFTNKIIHFIDLPALVGKPITLCVLANENLNKLFADFEWKQVNGQDIQVLYIKQPPQLSDQCNILYIGHSEKHLLRYTLKQTASLGKLVSISDIEQFAKLGGIVEFKIHQNNIKMDINLSKATQIGIRFSSKLLEVANIVPGGQ